MRIIKFLIKQHVYILLLILLITTVQLINCEQPPVYSHKESHITLTAKDGTIYTYNPKPPKALRLGKGSFGDAVIGERIENGMSIQVAMKIEKIAKNHIPMLHNEQRMYKILNGQAGIPHFFEYFHNYHGKAILVIELLGKSLDSLLEAKKKFSIKTSMMIGLQVLDIVESIHKKDLIYSDMKPNNLAIGREDKSKIYVLDFGLSTFYMKNGKHVKPSHGHGAGTAKYMSLYAHSHFVQSRRDDIESIAYLLIAFLNGRIWSTDVVKDIIHEKSTWSIKKIAGHTCTDTMVEFLKYARGMNFTDSPDYGFLRGLLQDELSKHQLINDGHFDWMDSSKETAEVSQSPIMEMNPVHEHSNEIPQFHLFSTKMSPIEPANQMHPMNVLLSSNNQKTLNGPMIVQHPQIQNVLLAQPMMRLTQPVTHSLPIVSNVLPASFAIHPQIQPHQQQLQHLTPILVQ